MKDNKELVDLGILNTINLTNLVITYLFCFAKITKSFKFTKKY